MPSRTLTHGSKTRSQGASASWLLRVDILLIAGLVVNGGLLGVTSAHAHDGGEFGIDIPVERVAPGDDLPIIGAEWAPNSVLEVGLQPSGAGLERIGAIRTDADGHFETVVRLPARVVSGLGVIQVTSRNGVLASDVVTIDPAAPPTGADSPGLDTAPNAELDPFSVVALAAAVLAMGLLVVKTRRRPTAP